MEHVLVKAKDTRALDGVLAWAEYGDSVDKLDLLKSFCTTLGLDELHHLKNILGHVRTKPQCRKRKWKGVSWEDHKKARDMELQPTAPGTVELEPMSPNLELVPPVSSADDLQPMAHDMESQPATSMTVELRPMLKIKPWWRDYEETDIVALDAEKVGLKLYGPYDASRKWREVIGYKDRAGIIGIVDSTYATVLKKTVYYKPGSFNTHPKTVAISGIRRDDLITGEAPATVRQKVKEMLKERLVITVAGKNDFISMGVECTDYKDTFDLQEFYRRPHGTSKNKQDTQPMSLRDIYHYHFDEDIQFRKPHDVIEDTRNTMRIFMEGYIPLKFKYGTMNYRKNVEGIKFKNAPNLNRKEENCEFYCKPSGEFKVDCKCVYCVWYKVK